MNPILKNTLAVVVGFAIATTVNMALIVNSASIIAPPAGADVTTAEGLKASLHLFEPRHFIMPFLAHALGTLAGAYSTARVAASHQFQCAMGIGVLFLCAGIANAFMLPAPAWFIAVDVIGAYLPMAWLGAKLARPKA